MIKYRAENLWADGVGEAKRKAPVGTEPNPTRSFALPRRGN
jgi:hypothetical protein